MKVISLTAEEVERFHSYVDRSGGPDACWPWKGARDKRKPYGFFWARRSYRAHRVAFAIGTGVVVPDNVMVRHVKCNNPPCCNHAHLDLGSHHDNVTDRVAAGRSARGERNGASKLTREKVLEIRARARDGESASNVLGPEYGVSSTTVRQIRDGVIWAHVASEGAEHDVSQADADRAMGAFAKIVGGE